MSPKNIYVMPQYLYIIRDCDQRASGPAIMVLQKIAHYQDSHHTHIYHRRSGSTVSIPIMSNRGLIDVRGVLATFWSAGILVIRTSLRLFLQGTLLGFSASQGGRFEEGWPGYDAT
jgi:hypothetical protein